MLYTYKNTQRSTTVHDLDSRATLQHAMSVDTDSGEIVCAVQPLSLGPDGKVAVMKLRYEHVWPIVGLDKWQRPIAFHCCTRIH